MYGPQELKLHVPITLKSMSGVSVRLQTRLWCIYYHWIFQRHGAYF